jgi:protoporphyrinogen oxidase
MSDSEEILVIGAGPAGLSSAYYLAKRGRRVCILESDPIYVGGISRTARHGSFYFDIGGHRFFSKSEEVERFWTEILPDDMLDRPRLSRIYYNGRFFSYPLKPLDAFLKLGPVESAHCMVSYLAARLRPSPTPVTFEDWVVNQFGRRLFEIFFKTYTEKVWGMKCSEISAEWAAQRIKGLSLWGAIRNALTPQCLKRSSRSIKTLISTFRYPRLGPGMLWEACARRIEGMGGRVLMGRHVVGCQWNEATGQWTVKAALHSGGEEEFQARQVICSAPLGELIPHLSPPASPTAISAARQLRYRDFITVAIILRDRGLIPDNWIYIHDPSVCVGRIQNFKSWSPEMAAEPGLTCYGLEYFCFEGDGLWCSPDAELVQTATRELMRIGLAQPDDIVDAAVVRQKKAYPVYDFEYKNNLARIRNELKTHYPGMWVVGRNGMHKYNNQDHAVMTGMLAAENVLAGRDVYDIWQVNEDAEYLEEGSAAAASGLRMTPTRIQG